MNKAAFWLYLLLSFLLTSIAPALIPSLKLAYWTPFLVLSMYLNSQKTTLWLTFIAGLNLDLLASNTPFGFWVVILLAASKVARMLKPYFFIDKLFTFPALSFFFSSISTLLFTAAHYLFYSRNLPSFSWVAIDMFLLPLADAFYCFLVVSLPFKYANKIFIEKKRFTRSFKLVKE